MFGPNPLDESNIAHHDASTTQEPTDASTTPEPPATHEAGSRPIAPNLSTLQSTGEFTGYPAESIDTDDCEYYDAMHEDDYALQDEMTNPVAFLAKTDEDAKYYHQAMSAPDNRELVRAMVKEFNYHCERGHLELFPISQVPTGTKILDSVWSMKRKRGIRTRDIIK